MLPLVERERGGRGRGREEVRVSECLPSTLSSLVSPSLK